MGVVAATGQVRTIKARPARAIGIRHLTELVILIKHFFPCALEITKDRRCPFVERYLTTEAGRPIVRSGIADTIDECVHWLMTNMKALGAWPRMMERLKKCGGCKNRFVHARWEPNIGDVTQ